MNRKLAIITATFAVLAMSSCSTIRQLDRIDRGGNDPTPTTVYVVDIGTPAFPVIPSLPDPAAEVLAGTAVSDPTCDLAGFPNPCQTPATTIPGPAQGVCLDGQPVTTGCPRP